MRKIPGLILLFVIAFSLSCEEGKNTENSNGDGGSGSEGNNLALTGGEYDGGGEGSSLSTGDGSDEKKQCLTDGEKVEQCDGAGEVSFETISHGKTKVKDESFYVIKCKEEYYEIWKLINSNDGSSIGDVPDVDLDASVVYVYISGSFVTTSKIKKISTVGDAGHFNQCVLIMNIKSPPDCTKPYSSYQIVAVKKTGKSDIVKVQYDTIVDEKDCEDTGDIGK